MSSRSCTSPTMKSTLMTPRRAISSRASVSASSVCSSAVTRPGATSAARSAVMVPGPQPTSSNHCPGCSLGSRYAAELSAVRQRCERSTDSWCPCRYSPAMDVTLDEAASAAVLPPDGLGSGSATATHDRANHERHRVEDGREDRDQEHGPADVADPRDAARLVLRIGAVVADCRQRKETDDRDYETDVDELGPLEDSLHDFPHISMRLNVPNVIGR